MRTSPTVIGITMKHRRPRRCIPILSALVLIGFTGCSDGEQQAKQAAQMKALQEQVATAASDLKRSADALGPSIEASRTAVTDATKRLDEAASSIAKDAVRQLEAQQQRLATVAEQLKQAADAIGPSAAEGRKSIADAAQAIRDASTAMAAEAASMRDTSGSVKDAVGRLDTAVNALSERSAARAKQSAELAEQAAASGRLQDAVILLTSAAMTDPANPSHATRLSELALRDQAATPESLSAAATTVRALAMQCSGESVTTLWRSADALSAKADELLAAAAKLEADAAVQAAERARQEACGQLSSAAQQNFLGATARQRAEMIQGLTDAIDEAGGECSEIDNALATLVRWQRVIRFDEAVQQADLALVAVDREQRAGRGAGTAAASILASAEASLRTLWSTPEADVGSERMARATTLQERFKMLADTVLDDRDAPLRAKMQKTAEEAQARARAVRTQLGDSAPARQGTYAKEIANVQDAMMKLASDAAMASGRQAAVEAGRHQVALQALVRELSESQYKSYCKYVAGIVRAQIDLARKEVQVTQADAVGFAKPLYAIDPASLPGPLAEAYGSFWQYLLGECNFDAKWTLTKERMDAPSKLSPAEF